jgi:hypothetical protein
VYGGTAVKMSLLALTGHYAGSAGLARLQSRVALAPLSDDTDLSAAVTERGELYRLLCVAIWDRQSLGFPSALPEPKADTADATAAEPAVPKSPGVPASRESTSKPTDVQKMIRKGVLAPGTTLIGNVGGADTTARVQPDGQLRLATGDVFRKPDDAARAVTGKRTAGMGFWHVTSPDGARITLRQLRNQGNQQTR